MYRKMLEGSPAPGLSLSLSLSLMEFAKLASSLYTHCVAKLSQTLVIPDSINNVEKLGTCHHKS
uniref:Uncharacterized protein n=1 Tax=Physcomitrium patens TaxID=3218 RepID=A0A2K1L361_PHYPA|nr:hypothetical protein PHYPA_003260 [Physcomitrium patens]